MINKIRGEAAMHLAGREFRLCLTLGALAEIEAGLGLTDLGALGERLARPSAKDLLLVLTALLRGGGEAVSGADVANLPLDARTIAAAVRETFAAAGFGEATR
jgi:hypothetical protein